MTEATIRIPGNLNVKKISDEIVYRAFEIAIEKKKKEIRRELKRVNSKIGKFEKKYNTSYEEYEQTMGDSFQHHDDWMDWGFLIESRKRLLEEIGEFEIR